MDAIDVTSLAHIAAHRRDEFARAAPFPHVVIDDFLHPEAADAVVREFPLPTTWTFLHHVNEKKLSCNVLSEMGPASRGVIGDLQTQGFLDALETLSGVSGLRADPELDGGGLQQTLSGGFLNVHTDFLAHTKRRHWSRQINLLLFLNRDWPDAYGGALELWDGGVTRCVQRIAPLFNRCVIFRTGRTSFHGVPGGVTCPPDRARRSLALYYFREEAQVCRLVPTRYVPLPHDPPARRALIRADGWLIHAYSVLKRYSPVTDRLASRILKHL